MIACFHYRPGLELWSQISANMCTRFCFIYVVHCNTTNGDINCTSDTTTVGAYDESGCTFCCNAGQGLKGVATNNGGCLLDHSRSVGNPLCIKG